MKGLLGTSQTKALLGAGTDSGDEMEVNKEPGNGVDKGVRKAGDGLEAAQPQAKKKPKITITEYLSRRQNREATPSLLVSEEEAKKEYSEEERVFIKEEPKDEYCEGERLFLKEELKDLKEEMENGAEEKVNPYSDGNLLVKKEES